MKPRTGHWPGEFYHDGDFYYGGDFYHEIKPGIPLNLAFFNQQDQSGEKTEPATPRKKEKARKEGQVLKSQELSTAALLLTGFAGLWAFGGYMFSGLTAMMAFGLGHIGRHDIELEAQTFGSYIGMGFGQVLITALPMLLIVMATGVLINLAQVGWHPTGKPLRPKLSKVSPIKGFKRIFSLRALIELFKSVLKLVIISIVIYMIIMGEADTLPLLYTMGIAQVVSYIGGLVINIGLMVGALYLFIAALDFTYQWWKHTKELRMTKQEVKEEYKQTEGNPVIKGAIRRKMREISMRRMMQQVPGADVIITNPTHYAVALKYNKELGEAPVVVAKGVDYVARRIKENAALHGVEVVENKPLARTLYDTVDIGREIPPELYQAVAEIFAHLVSINKVAVS